MHKAVLTTESIDAKSIAKALSVDNSNDAKLKIKTISKNNKIKTKIITNSMATLLRTLDDIIQCQMVAEKTIKDGNC